METTYEEIRTTETNESNEETRPLSSEEKELLMKMGVAFVLIGSAAIYGVATAGYQVGRSAVRKIQKHRANKKPELKIVK